jgi:hypothetical protein
MSGKTIFEMESPKTQTVEAVQALAAFLKRDLSSGVLDLGGAKLVLSNKKDSYYVVTPKSCSCPSATYRGGPCKHQRRYFPQPKSQAARDAEVEAELAKERGAKRLARPPEDSIRPTGRWHGHNGPVMPEVA